MRNVLSDNARPKIGIYDPFTPGLGGLYRYVQGVISELDPAKFDVTVFCHPNRPFSTKPGIEVVPVLPYASSHHSAQSAVESTGSNGHRPETNSVRSSRGWVRWIPRSARVVLGYTKSAMRIARLFRPYGFDLVHTFETDADPAVLAARIAGVPKVLYTYQVDSTYRPLEIQRCPGHRLTEIITDRCLTIGIAASNQTRRDRLRRTHPGAHNIVIIPNGIDTTRFVRTFSRSAARMATGIPDDGRWVIGTTGRLHRHKGHEYLIRAVAALRRRDILVAIAGSGELLAQLKQLSRELDIENQVLFLGQRSDIVELLQSFDIFALPSVCEALPYSLLEAMSIGLPVVATDVGGVSELIEEECSGLVVPPANSEALAIALGRILNASTESRNQMSEAARRRVVTRFHESNLMARTVALYDSYLS